MTTESEITDAIAVLHFAVTNLYVAECQRQEDPVGAAKALSQRVENAIMVLPEGGADLQNALRSFFGQVVASVQAASGRADA